MINLSQVREEILIERYNEVSEDYKKYSLELKIFIDKLIALRTELTNLENELKNRGLLNNGIHTGSK